MVRIQTIFPPTNQADQPAWDAHAGDDRPPDPTPSSLLRFPRPHHPAGSANSGLSGRLRWARPAGHPRGWR